MRAAAAGHADVVKILLEAGANPRIRDETSATAADLARQLGHAEALASLESHASRTWRALLIARARRLARRPADRGAALASAPALG